MMGSWMAPLVKQKVQKFQKFSMKMKLNGMENGIKMEKSDN